jgi:hypothetical protein
MTDAPTPPRSARAPTSPPRSPFPLRASLPLLPLLALVASVAPPSRAFAWCENEHLELVELALPKPAGRERAPEIAPTLQRAWTLALAAPRLRGKKLCPDLDHGILARTDAPACVDLPALALFAGDHSCSVADLDADLENAVPWHEGVLSAARAFQLDLDRIRAKHEPRAAERLDIQDARRDFNVTLLSVDSLYRARAQSNQPHFQIERPTPSDPNPPQGTGGTLVEYLTAALAPGALTNATAVYLNYHVAALRYAGAARAACGGSLCDKASDLLSWAFLSEAFALHFLEDSFSAGHFMGDSSDAIERLGTHDHYSDHGFPVVTWRHSQYGAYGDAFLEQDDRRPSTAAGPGPSGLPDNEKFASLAVRASLTQLAATLDPSVDAATASILDQNLSALDAAGVTASMDTCQMPQLPAGLAGLADPAVLGLFRDTIETEPIPAPHTPSPPTFREEYGPFFATLLSVNGGADHYAGHFEGVVEARGGLGAGVALDGIVSERKDGLALVDLLSSVEGRGDGTFSYGFGFRLRVPFAYVPGDILVWGGPAMLPAILDDTTPSPPWAMRAAARAMRGATILPVGLGPDILVDLNETWRFQLDGGRELTGMFFLDEAPDGTRRFERWELTAPYASLRGHHFDGTTANDQVIALSFKAGHSSLSGTIVGFSLSVADEGRFY